MYQWLKVNPIGVVLGVISYILLGIIFYSRWILGKFWPVLTSHMQKKADGVPLQVYLGSIISALLVAYAMGCLLNLIRAKTITSGLLLGIVLWAGFILPTIFAPVLFGKKPLEMFWLDSIFYLIAYITLGILSAKFK